MPLYACSPYPYFDRHISALTFSLAVGAKTFTMLQACIVGTVFELAGALSLGSAVTDTIAGSIARTSTFTQYPGGDCGGKGHTGSIARTSTFTQYPGLGTGSGGEGRTGLPAPLPALQPSRSTQMWEESQQGEREERGGGSSEGW